MSKSNKSRYAILGVLSLGRASGYDIKKMMQQSTAHFWRETDGSIYPILRDLETEGLVEVAEESRGARERKVYTLTKPGKKELLDWLEQPVEVDFVRNELLLKLFFSRLVSKKTTIKRIQDYKDRQQERQKIYREIERQILSEQDDDAKFWLMTLRFGQLHVDASLRWCEELLTKGL